MPIPTKDITNDSKISPNGELTSPIQCEARAKVKIPLGYERINNPTTAQSLTVPVGTTLILIQAEVEGIRFLDSSLTPTSTYGMPIVAGESFYYSGDPTRIKLIAITSGGSVHVAYYKT